MWHLPTVGNYIVQYDSGDGFRSFLPGMLNGYHLVISTRRMIDYQFRKGACRYVTKQGLKKLLQSGDPQEQCIVLDIQIPRMGSQAFRYLQQLCVGRSLILLHPPLLDIESINSLVTLLPQTKRKAINVIKWNKFMYQRNY